jgi:hypothetical protein
MCVATTNMKRKTLKQHKEEILVYEKGIFEVEVINNLLIPQSKTISSKKLDNLRENMNVLYKLS